MSALTRTDDNVRARACEPWSRIPLMEMGLSDQTYFAAVVSCMTAVLDARTIEDVIVWGRLEVINFICTLWADDDPSAYDYWRWPAFDPFVLLDALAHNLWFSIHTDLIVDSLTPGESPVGDHPFLLQQLEDLYA